MLKTTIFFLMQSILIAAPNPTNELVRPLSSVHHYEEIQEDQMTTTPHTTIITTENQPTNSYMSDDTNDYLVPRTTIPQI